MITVGDLFNVYRPGIIFGAVLGFLVSLYLETLGGGEGFFVKVLEWNNSSQGLLVIGVFAVVGFVVQWWMGWKAAK